MNIIVAVDDRLGMLFNRRRQSQDQAVRTRILEMTSDSVLRMNSYSFRQFEKETDAARILVSEDFLHSAAQYDYCFVETEPLLPVSMQIEKVILFRWNRSYPGDFSLDLDLEDPSWVLTYSEEFPGSSHSKITMEVYDHAKRKETADFYPSDSQSDSAGSDDCESGCLNFGAAEQF